MSRCSASVVAAVMVTAGCAATLLAQTSGAGVGSLAELTAEVRLLRLAVEQSGRTQTQAQALGIFLSAQQSRILQMTTRLDVARKELDGIAQRSIEHANELASLEELLPRLSNSERPRRRRESR